MEAQIDNYIASNGSLDDLLFRGKNKGYGAYFLRKEYPKHLKKSLMYFLLGVCLLSLSYIVWDRLKDKIKFSEDKAIRKVTELAAPPPLEDKSNPPPPPPPPPPPVKSTIQFVPPKVVEVAPEEEMKTNEEINKDKAAIASQTVEGTTNAADLEFEDPGNGTEAPKNQEPFNFVEQMPEFPGGEDALMAYLSRNIKYPAYAQENEIEGTVMINFVVEPDGSVSGAKVTKGLKGGCEDEALRVIRGMPKWRAGKQAGQAVRVYYDVPVTFSLGE